MAKSTRRDPAAEVAASESPLLRRMQQTATPPAPTPPPVEPAEAPKAPPAKAPRAASKKPRTPRVKPVLDEKPVPKRVLTPPDDSELQDAMAKTLGRYVGTTVQWSVVTRAMWSLLLSADEVLDQVPAPNLKRPSNGAERDEIGEFEAELGRYLHRLIKAIK